MAMATRRRLSSRKAEKEAENENPEAPDQDEQAAKDFEQWHKLMLRQVRSVKSDYVALENHVKVQIDKIHETLTAMDADAELSSLMSGELAVVRCSFVCVQRFEIQPNIAQQKSNKQKHV